MTCTTATTTAGRPASVARTSRIGLRTTQKQEYLLRLASEATQKSLTDFVLDSACMAAERALIDQHLFLLSPEKYNEFVALLERPAQDNPGLRALFARKAPWEQA